MPIYLDSPLAIKATELHLNYPDLADSQARQVSRTGQLWRGMETLRPCITTDESRALNHVGGPCIIIAGAGMCSGGRILHHFQHNLWRPETTVIFVGYQAAGTLGRLLIEGARRIRIFGEAIAVRAEVHTLGGFSAHAGQSELVQWLAPMARGRPRVILTHGEERGRVPLAQCIAERFAISAELPLLEDVITDGC